MLGCASVVLALVVGVVVFVRSQTMAVTVPASIEQQAVFAIYVPTALPGSYQIVPESWGNEEGVVVYSLRNASGGNIALTEQSVPANFDFTGFYESQMKDIRRVDGATYESVIGGSSVNADAKSRLLSIRAEDTWVLVSTQTATDADLEFIARHIRKY